MISLSKVTKEYNLDEQIITPVCDVSLEIKKGEFVIIIGRSGTGKSTMLNLVAGLVKPTRGEIAIDGESVEGMSDSKLSRLRSEKIGYVFQFPSLLPSLSILENIAMPATFSTVPRTEPVLQRAEELLKTLGLGERMDCYPRHLSAGEQKRAVIARSLLNSPPILLADEPTSDLDELTEREIMQLLKEIHNTGVTILMVTHSLQLMPYATRSYRMENGKLSATRKNAVS